MTDWLEKLDGICKARTQGPMGTIATELLAVVWAGALLEASEGGWGADERYVQLKEALAALKAKCEGLK